MIPLEELKDWELDRMLNDYQEWAEVYRKSLKVAKTEGWPLVHVECLRQSVNQMSNLAGQVRAEFARRKH